jgi:hypothetical protein
MVKGWFKIFLEKVKLRGNSSFIGMVRIEIWEKR